MTERTRAYIYRIAMVVVPLLIAYGVISDSDAALWLGVLAAVLDLGTSALAAKHTSTAPPGG
jgi:hypothetical protein